MSGTLLAAIDVGTGSARAGVLTARGALLGRAAEPIAMRRVGDHIAEHDSADIWRAVGIALKAAMAAAGAHPDDVCAISFDATCSLVVHDAAGSPLPVSPDEEPRWDTIVWLDHRAITEASEIGATGDPVLEHFGGGISPEMQLPKLLWLKRHVPGTWTQAGRMRDLVDELTYRATGSNARSRSPLVSKWGFDDGPNSGWPTKFLDRIGLADLPQRAGLPEGAVPPGADLGPLTDTAAAHLGLTTSCRVAAGLVDAHAGALGVLGARAGDVAALDRHLCLIAGTSNSILALAATPRPIPGVWGPYPGAIVPGAWLLEAGQSASGALLDHMIRWHAAGGEPTKARHDTIVSRIAELHAAEGEAFAADLHVLPDFHGNRSPLGDPLAAGVISGLSLDASFDGLCRLYWRTAVALALGVRQNLERLAGAGFATDRLLLAGGHARNGLLTRLYADASGATIVEPRAPDAVLLGTAMLAAAAAGLYPNLAAAAAAMDQGGDPREPDPARRTRFDRDYRIMLEMQRQRRALAALS